MQNTTNQTFYHFNYKKEYLATKRKIEILQKQIKSCSLVYEKHDILYDIEKLENKAISIINYVNEVCKKFCKNENECFIIKSRILQGMSFEEIGEVIFYTPQTTKNLFYKIVNRK